MYSKTIAHNVGYCEWTVKIWLGSVWFGFRLAPCFWQSCFICKSWSTTNTVALIETAITTLCSTHIHYMQTHFITCIPVNGIEIVAKICRKTWVFIHYASLRWVNTFQHWCYRVSAICRFIYISIAATNVNTILQIFAGAVCAKQTIDRDTTSSWTAENKEPLLNKW